MTLEIVPLEARHLRAAAELLAAGYRADRLVQPELPRELEESIACLPRITAEFEAETARGVLALDGGAPVGFLQGGLSLYSQNGPRSAHMGYDYAGHAAIGPGRADVYRAMYAALAQWWLALGYSTHYVTVRAADREALAAWRSLGFGMESVLGVRDLSPPAPVAPEPGGAIEVHRASSEDLEPVARLSTALSRYHAGAPIWLPYFTEAADERRRAEQESLADAHHAHWLAYSDGRLLGWQRYSAAPPNHVAMLAGVHCVHLHEGFTEEGARGGGAGRVLLERGLAWAREQGYARCSVTWKSPNLSGARFWLASGFVPAGYRLVRRIDERIGWSS